MSRLSMDQALRRAKPLGQFSDVLELHRKVILTSRGHPVVVFRYEDDIYALSTLTKWGMLVYEERAEGAETVGVLNSRSSYEDILAILGVEKMETAYRDERLDKLDKTSRPALIFRTIPRPGSWYVEDSVSGIRTAPLMGRDQCIEVYNEYVAKVKALREATK